MGASTEVSVQLQAGGRANNVSHITGTLHWPAPGKMASTDICVLSKGALHILRILKSYFSFTSKCIVGARPVALPLNGHFFFLQPHSVWAAHLLAPYLLLGLVREDFACLLPSDLALSPASS